LSHQVNDSFVAVNRLLKANEEVYWSKTAFAANGNRYGPGTMFIPSKPTTLPILQKLAADKGLRFDPIATRPAAVSAQSALKLRPVRIGLWDSYGGSMPSGWTRWILEQYEFPYARVFPKELDAGDLNAKFDVLIFVDEAIPMSDGSGTNQPDPSSIPEEYRDHLGRVTVARTMPELKKFAQNGGTLLTIGSSATSVAFHFELPVGDALVERVDGVERRLPQEKFYVPGSILDARVDNTHPLAYGMGERAMIYFDHSPAFRLEPQAKGVTPVVTIDSPSPLRSGWAWGQRHLEGAIEIAEATAGKGRIVLFGPEIAWRAQPHGTFKFLFNGIYYGSAVGAGGGPSTGQ
jgi:hypothetical protein